MKCFRANLRTQGLETLDMLVNGALTEITAVDFAFYAKNPRTTIFWCSRIFLFSVQGLIFRLAFAVNAAVDAFFPVGEFEDLGQLLFGGGDAAGVGAADDAGDIFGDIQMLALDGFAVADDIDGHIRVNVADRVKIQIDDLIDFDDVLFAHFYTVRVLNDGHRTVQLRQIQNIIQRHTLTGGDMVDDNAVIDGID